MSRLVTLEAHDVRPYQDYLILWNRAPAGVAFHSTRVRARSEQEAIDILRDHLGFNIDIWFEQEDEL